MKRSFAHLLPLFAAPPVPTAPVFQRPARIADETEPLIVAGYRALLS